MLALQGNVLAIILIAWALALCSCSIAVCLGSCITDVKKASELAPLVFVPQLLFVGFFVRINQIPTFLRWAQYLCSLKYAMNLMVIVEFNPNTPGCSVSEIAASNCERLWISNEISSEDIYVYILCLVGLFLVFRVIGCMILLYKTEYYST
jgi:ABC-type multidrug transport system permease subunit